MKSITLCLIAKNEEKNLPLLLENIKPVGFNNVVLVDTGSTDRTKEIGKAYGCHVYDFEWIDDFSAARNFCFDRAREIGDDWLMWLDVDDIIDKPELLRVTLDTLIAKNPECNMVVFPYNYAFDEYGNCAISLVRERLLRNSPVDSWIWEGRIHEYLLQSPVNVPVVENSITISHHHATDSGSRVPRRNLNILEKELVDVGGYEKASTRLLSYLGIERTAAGEFDKAFEAYSEYLKKDSTWVEEKYQILNKMALMLRDHYKNIEQHLVMLSNAHLLLPTWGDYYINLATFFLISKEYDKAIHFADETLRRGVPQTVLIINPMDYTFTPHVVKARAYAAMQQYQNAIDSLTCALNIRPIEELKREINQYYQMLMNEKAGESVVTLLPYIAEENVLKFVESLPEGMKSIPAVQDYSYRVIVKTDKADNNNKVAIFTGIGLEPWDYYNIDKQGIGGSETAAAYVAKEFVNEGYDVTLFGCPNEVRKIDGVLYTSARHFNPIEPRKLVISSRAPEIFNDVQNADNKWLWLHDINLGNRMFSTPDYKIDRYLFLSEYQKEHYFNLYPGIINEDKVMMIRNGIDTDKIEAVKAIDIKRDRQRIIWSSSPDRGLDILLHMFPKIREKYPKASLHIFYGWDNFDKVIQHNPQLAQFKEHIMQLCRQPRVFWRGRVSQQRLYEEMNKSGVWLYPTSWLETYCISSVEMMANGVFPIASDLAALSEIVPDELSIKIKGSNRYEDIQQKFIDAYSAVQEMSDEEYAELQKKWVDYAYELSWKSLVKDMIKEIK